MASTSRTVGPLHFEDLDPKRFEDLIRQLAYEFRPWRRLEATGRSGSDDGFDARGLEIVSTSEDARPEQEDAEDADEPSATTTDRLWLIQCKREKTIGPTKLVSYLDDIGLKEGEALYGIVLAAATDFSKQARDKFFAKCRELGVQECYLWGKGELEDLLFQPKNDHLLFAYFGFSLTIRQRSVQATLRRDIATKKRLKTVIEKASERTLLIRNANGDVYPEVPPRGKAFTADHWRLCPFDEFSYEGLVVEIGAYFAFLDGEKWDAADAIGMQRSWLYLGHWGRDADKYPPHDEAHAIWDAFDLTQRAWFKIYGAIPYDRILAIDDVGDELFEGPQAYCRYESGVPWATAYASVAAIGDGRTIYVGTQDPRRIEKFPPALRREPV